MRKITNFGELGLLTRIDSTPQRHKRENVTWVSTFRYKEKGKGIILTF